MTSHRAPLSFVVACLFYSVSQTAEAFSCRSNSKRLSRTTTGPFSTKLPGGIDEAVGIHDDHPRSNWLTRRSISKVFIAAGGLTGTSIVTWADEAADAAAAKKAEEKKKAEEEKAAKKKAEDAEKERIRKEVEVTAAANRKVVFDAAEAKRSMTTADIIEAQKLKNKQMFGGLQEGNKKARGL